MKSIQLLIFKSPLFSFKKSDNSFSNLILPGSKIGDHVVIGANSVVTGEIPAYSVAVGSPARVVRQYDGNSWERKETRISDTDEQI